MKTFYYQIVDKKYHRKTKEYTYYIKVFEIDEKTNNIVYLTQGNYNTGITRGRESEIFKMLARIDKVEKEFINSYATEVETYNKYKLEEL